MPTEQEIEATHRKALRTFQQWQLPTGLLIEGHFTNLTVYLRETRSVAKLLRDRPEEFATSRGEHREFQIRIMKKNAGELYGVCGLVVKAYHFAKSGDTRYLMPVAKMMARVGALVEHLTLIAGPLEKDGESSTLLELALIGNEAHEQRKASKAQAVKARTNTAWRSRAEEIWRQHPAWTQNRVAGEVAGELGADKRSIMRAIKPLIPETSPSHPTMKQGQSVD